MMNLKQQYEFSLKILTILMPISAVFFVVMGIVFCFKLGQLFYFAFIFFGISAMVLGMFFFIRAYIKKKLSEIEKREKN